MQENWTELLYDYFNLGLTAKQSQRWLFQLNEGSNAIRTDNEELCDAIHMVVDDPDKQSKYKPDLRTLRIWVFMLRKMRRGNTYGPSDDDFTSKVWLEMQRVFNHISFLEAWCVMVEPERAGFERSTTVEECEHLHRIALERLKGWRRPTRKEICGDDKDVRSNLSGVMKSAKPEKMITDTAIKNRIHAEDEWKLQQQLNEQ